MVSVLSYIFNSKKAIFLYTLIFLFTMNACQTSNKKEGHKEKKHHHKTSGQNHAPYAGQQKRDLKAFPPKVIKQLKNGSGHPFYGMAKPAELNSYPGPKHILKAKQRLDLTATQEEKVQQIFVQMHKRAKELGDSLLANERQIERAFATQRIDKKKLQTLINKSAQIYGTLRFTHLQAHIKAQELLNREQIEKYNSYRGYK